MITHNPFPLMSCPYPWVPPSSSCMAEFSGFVGSTKTLGLVASVTPSFMLAPRSSVLPWEYNGHDLAILWCVAVAPRARPYTSTALESMPSPASGWFELFNTNLDKFPSLYVKGIHIYFDKSPRTVAKARRKLSS
jgi:hypothetical protein